jgi:hypothetical protein
MPGNLTRRRAIGSILTFAGFAYPLGRRLLSPAASTSAFDGGTELQPLMAQVRRPVEAMASVGEPFSDAERQGIEPPRTWVMLRAR